MRLLKVLRFILNHPLNRDQRLAALRRYARWQIGSRLLPGSVAFPYVNDARLFARRGLTVANVNLYTGLDEFPDMAFLLHVLRPEDIFIDIGANVGTYTILASAAIGARTIAVEPSPSIFEELLDNIRLNRVEERVEALRVAVGREPGTIRFVLERLNAVSHVLAEGETDEATIEVPVRSLDDIVGAAGPAVIKIDVEGFETEVIAGGQEALARPGLLAVIMETNRLARRYDFDEMALHRTMLGLGFEAHRYEPWERRLHALGENELSDENTLYLRDVDAIRERLRSAPPFTVNGREI